MFSFLRVREGGSSLMVSALDSRASGPGLSSGGGHCVVSLGKTLYSHSVSFHSSVGTGELNAGGNPVMECIPSRASRNTPSCFMLQKPG